MFKHIKRIYLYPVAATKVVKRRKYFDAYRGMRVGQIFNLYFL